MRSFILSLIFISGLSFTIHAQNQSADSLNQLLKISNADTNRVNLLLKIAQTYFFSKPDTCLFYSEEALELARKLHFISGEVTALNVSGEALRFIGNYPRALKMQIAAVGLNRKMKDPAGEAVSLGFIGLIYVEFREYRLGLKYLLPSLELNRQLSNRIMETFTLTNIGNAYNLLKMHDSALYYQRMALKYFDGLKHGPLKSLILTRYGNAFVGLVKKDSALFYFQMAMQNANTVIDIVNISKIQIRIAELYESSGGFDSSLYYARKGFVNSQQSAQISEILAASNLLKKLFRQTKNSDSALFYQEIAYTMNDSLYGPQKFKDLQLLMLEEQEREQKVIRDQEQFKNKIRYTILISALGIFLLLAFILIRNNRQKQKANNLLKEQKIKIENTLTELKATQSQLLQSEKMASLGELTAGIAHEIQNPLNFVNNFSEVNKELVDEMQAELKAGKIEGAIAISNDIKENEEKINHHGKRADAIVKGMLQHSRRSSGVKEPTDINALADEYLRLAYHGLRAKDKSFNATMITEYDESIGNIRIIPQDLGRVILNLITNAFYAASLPSAGGFSDSDNNKSPKVWVSTKKVGDTVFISVRDNGPGIPQKILDKIFQPFFTTKPTGQGTGLGLSLSYDIVKAHGGELKVETKEGEGSTFIVSIPV